MFHASRVCAAALLAAGLGGCQMLGGSSGVMPDSEIGPPPSERSNLPGRQYRPNSVDPEGAPVAGGSSRQLALPGSARGGGRSADAGERRIRREDLSGGNAVGGGGGSGGGVGPALTPSGGMGVGGRF